MGGLQELLPAGWKIPGRQQQSNRDLEQRGRAYRTYHGMYYRKCMLAEDETVLDTNNCPWAVEFVERYLHKGTKIVLTGRIQTGSYTNKDGQRVYTTDIVAEDQEFAESKNAESGNAGGYNTQPAPAPQSGNDGFMPAGDDSELPFV